MQILSLCRAVLHGDASCPEQGCFLVHYYSHGDRLQEGAQATLGAKCPEKPRLFQFRKDLGSNAAAKINSAYSQILQGKISRGSSVNFNEHIDRLPAKRAAAVEPVPSDDSGSVGGIHFLAQP